MTFFFIFCIPVITCCVLYWKFREETVLPEYFFVIVPSILIYLLFKFAFLSARTNDIEYHGSYVTSIEYYEPWDEQVWVTKTREVPDGVDEDGNTIYRTETYRELEYRYHGSEYFYTKSNSSSKHYLSESMYNRIKNTLKSKPVFKDMHRDYYKLDGDAYITYWDKTEEHIYTLTTSHYYVNKVQASDHSIFKFHELNDSDVVKNKLYDYPDIINLDQTPILTNQNNVTMDEIKAIRYINGFYGRKCQIRVYILLFDSDNPEVAELQRSYWEGGNKNEFVVCLGVDNRTVKWCRTFSWADDPWLDVYTRKYFRNNHSMNLVHYSKSLRTKLNKWHRKEFKDFDYLQIELTQSQIIWLFILVIIYNIGISIFIVTNDLNKRTYI